MNLYMKNNNHNIKIVRGNRGQNGNIYIKSLRQKPEIEKYWMKTKTPRFWSFYMVCWVEKEKGYKYVLKGNPQIILRLSFKIVIWMTIY